MKQNSNAKSVALMALALAFYTERPDIYLRDFGTNRIVRQTYIWKARTDKRGK